MAILALSEAVDQPWAEVLVLSRLMPREELPQESPLSIFAYRTTTPTSFILRSTRSHSGGDFGLSWRGRDATGIAETPRHDGKSFLRREGHRLSLSGPLFLNPSRARPFGPTDGTWPALHRC